MQALTPSFASARDQHPTIGNVTYYGATYEIINIDYWGKFNVVLFRFVWFQVEKDEYELTCVNFNKLGYFDDPFDMASQVKQVFYIEDQIEAAYIMLQKGF